MDGCDGEGQQDCDQLRDKKQIPLHVDVLAEIF